MDELRVVPSRRKSDARPVTVASVIGPSPTLPDNSTTVPGTGSGSGTGTGSGGTMGAGAREVVVSPPPPPPPPQAVTMSAKNTISPARSAEVERSAMGGSID